jgi:general secretion pathway protein L
VIGRREGDGPIDAELVVVPRTGLDPQLAMLGPASPSLAGIDVAGADGVPLEVNLLPPAQRQRVRDPWRTWNLGFAAISVLALGLTLWLVLENRRGAADNFDAQVAREAEPARRASAQQQELTNLIQGQAFLQRKRSQYPTAVEVMDELSRRLPDGTSLEKLAIEENRLTLIGLSNEAPALVGRLQDSKLWRSPGLNGALQTDPSTRKDRFTLTADIGPADTKETSGARSGQ